MADACAADTRAGDATGGVARRFPYTPTDFVTRFLRITYALTLALAALALLRPRDSAPARACAGDCTRCPACPAATGAPSGAAPAPAADTRPDPPKPAAKPAPVFNPARCKDCEKCLAACPTGALERVEADGKVVYRIDPKRCDGCGKCVAACRKKALTSPTP